MHPLSYASSFLCILFPLMGSVVHLFLPTYLTNNNLLSVMSAVDSEHLTADVAAGDWRE